jgi:hypothetical protein
MTDSRKALTPTSGSSTQVPAVLAPAESHRVTQAILDFVSQIPPSRIGADADPHAAARRLGHRAAQRAALTAGSLALPPGPLGWLTVLPELIAIWRIQAQMVSDIAAAYGKQASLGREQMLWCLFRHTAAQAFRDLVIRMGDRLLFRRMSYTVVERVAKQIGVKITQRAVGKGVARWLPVVGALGVGAYAYYDTGHVAATAIELFSGDVQTEGGINAADAGAAVTATKATARHVVDRSGKPTAAGAMRKAAGNVVRKTVDKAVAGAVRRMAKTADAAAARKSARKTVSKPATSKAPPKTP